jgi:aryl-alcohol dehydrogenase-like predicted oxidoreductase
LARAWILAQKPWIVPIPGTRSLTRLEENLGGAEIDLTPSDIAKIEEVSKEVRIAGACYPEEFMKMSGI